jgi:hypothetical protein
MTDNVLRVRRTIASSSHRHVGIHVGNQIRSPQPTDKGGAGSVTMIFTNTGRIDRYGS